MSTDLVYGALGGLVLGASVGTLAVLFVMDRIVKVNLRHERLYGRDAID